MQGEGRDPPAQTPGQPKGDERPGDKGRSSSAAHQTSQARACTPLCTSCVLPTTPGAGALCCPRARPNEATGELSFCKLSPLLPRSVPGKRTSGWGFPLGPAGGINAVHPPPTPSDSQQPPSHNLGSLPYQLEPSQRQTHTRFTSRSSMAGPAPTTGSWEPAG